jgi:hypothetical protein
MLPCYEGAGVTNARVLHGGCPILRALCEGWDTTNLSHRFSAPPAIYLSLIEE